MPSPATRLRLGAAAGTIIVAFACSATAGPVRPEPTVGRPVDPAGARTAKRTSEPKAAAGTALAGTAAPPQIRPSADRVVRVLLGVERQQVPFSADVRWQVLRRGDRAAVASGAPGREWRIERDGLQLRVVRSDGVATDYRRGMLELLPAPGTGLVTYGTRRYRGSLTFHATDTGVLVVNTLPLEEYVRGVVPREIGGARPMSEIAAVEAQAVAARTYAITRRAPAASFDLRATTADQVYGGADAETAVSNRAVENTAGLVLRYGTRIVNAPYHSTCGGSTADAQEVWRTRPEPYLQRVSDRIPGTSRDYCDPSPRYRWTKSLDAATLDAAIARHLGALQPVPRGGPGRVRTVRVETRAPSGRAGMVAIVTTSRTYTVRGNDARSVLRQPGGEILNSAYFTVLGPADARGGVRLEGRGYGHGVGMCQWGAIGRARAGQGFRAILQAYFPGTTVGPAS